MKCRNHPSEQGPGICALCLRDRLLILLAEQNPGTPNPNPPHHLLPQSVSPYASRRRRRRFFSTPQVVSGDGDGDGGRFSLLSYLFTPRRSENKEPEPRVSDESKSGSWIRGLIRGKKSRALSPVRNRGMSPEAREYRSESGYSTASSGPMRMATPSPMRKATHRNSHGISGLGACLSPMVRASPARCQRREAVTGFSGELGGSLNFQHRHVAGSASASASLVPNRSRKLADFGRFR